MRYKSSNSPRSSGARRRKGDVPVSTVPLWKQWLYGLLICVITPSCVSVFYWPLAMAGVDHWPLSVGPTLVAIAVTLIILAVVPLVTFQGAHYFIARSIMAPPAVPQANWDEPAPTDEGDDETSEAPPDEEQIGADAAGEDLTGVSQAAADFARIGPPAEFDSDSSSPDREPLGTEPEESAASADGACEDEVVLAVNQDSSAYPADSIVARTLADPGSESPPADHDYEDIEEVAEPHDSAPAASDDAPGPEPR
jgi:hypothetical protein